MALKEQLEDLVGEMVTKGIRYDDAQREFEKKFIALVLSKSDGNLCRAAELLGMHRSAKTTRSLWSRAASGA
jgi:DNA-binding protein Fis